MPSYRHLLLLLAPAAVLSVSDDGTSTMETAASQLPDFIETAHLAPRGSFPPWKNVHPVLHVRADQMNEVIEIPSDQMSGVVRVTYDPDLEANKESLKPATSPTLVSPLVERGPPAPKSAGVGDNVCALHREPGLAFNTRFVHLKTECRPEKSERAYETTCRSIHGFDTVPLQRECPVNFICVQLPESAGRLKVTGIECRPVETAKKASTSNSGGIIRTITQFFKAPPKGYKKLHFDAYTFDRNGNQIKVQYIDGVADGSIFKREVQANALIVDKLANINGEGVYFDAYAGTSFITLEWWWRRSV
ncbi:hypothetical protein Vi05172_g1366 [Venturia inaequalis]|nr:hypothetical protein Vi05172_g1366 [Venturia inaequalis]